MVILVQNIIEFSVGLCRLGAIVQVICIIRKQLHVVIELLILFFVVKINRHSLHNNYNNIYVLQWRMIILRARIFIYEFVKLL